MDRQAPGLEPAGDVVHGDDPAPCCPPPGEQTVHDGKKLHPLELGVQGVDVPGRQFPPACRQDPLVHVCRGDVLEPEQLVEGRQRRRQLRAA